MVEQRENAKSAPKVAVITVSDRGSRGEREDKSGPHAVARLDKQGYHTTSSMVGDGADTVAAAIRAAINEGADVVITSGGTGVAPRDLTPEGTRPLLTRELPGIAEQLRREGVRSTPMAILSRGLAGIAGTTLVVNLPGSVKAVDEGLDVLIPLLPHILDQVRGGDH
ncbi:MAG: MogA/MoaB family molybdenum cofactor biosynthesis protein [Microbacteriaceae bacterium]|nr:MogA/MoaB family molybdenum cofactor biosynthesis protein [Microbacteriaceae bacterium]